MKRTGVILCLTALIVAMTASLSFGAQPLKIVEHYPGDEQKNTSIENMGVKLTFNNDVGDKDSRKANRKCFTITDDKGQEIPIRVFFDPDDSKKVMVLADTIKIAENKDLKIKDNTKYTLTISGELKDNDGNTLGQDEVISFTTLNQSRNNSIYMVMMVIMFGGMFFFSSRQAKKQMAKDNENRAKEEPFNPYKEAKKTGKSVQEVVAAHEKEVAKKAAKDAKKHRRDEEDDEEYEEEDNGNYKVKGPHTVREGGSAYITGRKALAEARAAEEERLAKRRAANAKKKKKK
ncbi:MAG: Ig-like domain-containing protein [Emergencia sp.]|nr:Ig-like domain-containing protein [Emergencia sp.]